MSVGSSPAFAELLRRYRLLEPTQLEEVERTLVPRLAEPKALGRELLQRSWLTAFQVNQLLQGRAQDLVLGSYVLLERVGEGGMGAVYKARHAKLGRTVAVKVIRKERLGKGDAVRRFQREIRAAAQLNHPNIVRAFDADEVDGTHLLAMELVEGAVDLAKLVQERGPLPVADACDYIRQAALGLQHAFERGMVHRDIKPQNLLVVSGGVVSGKTIQGTPATTHHSRLTTHQVKILDMGLARMGQDDKGEDSRSALTQEGAVMGTLDYIAPEQARDSHSVDIRADLYSLGCTLFFLLTGRVPFPGGTAAQKLMKHQLDAPPSLQSVRPDVPAGVASIVVKLMAKRPEDRFQTPVGLAQALANPTDPVETGMRTAAATHIMAPARNVFADLLTGDTVVAASTPPAPAKAAPWPLPWKWLALGGGGVAGLLLLLLMLFNRGSDKNSPDQGGEVKPPTERKGGVVEPQANLDADRKAAEWVLSIGGTVKIKETGKEREIKAVADLPRTAFELDFVGLHGNSVVTNAQLAHLQNCKNLTVLALGGTQVSDAGLAHFQGCKNLKFLGLLGTQVSDAGLAHFQDCKNLAQLILRKTKVSAAGIDQLTKALPQCKIEWDGGVIEAKVSTDPDRKAAEWVLAIGSYVGVVADGTPVPVKTAGDLPKTPFELRSINVNRNPKVSDEALTVLRGLKHLTLLQISNSSASDVALAYFKDCKQLDQLIMHATKVTDAGLVHLEGFTQLQYLNLKQTAVTEPALKRLAAALPRCRIEWSGGVVEPRLPPAISPK